MTDASLVEFALFEHAIGYALFKVKRWDEIGMGVDSVAEAINKPDVFCQALELHTFQAFSDAEAGLASANALSEGLCGDDLYAMLSTHLPQPKKSKSKRILAVAEQKLAQSIAERIDHIGAVYNSTAQQYLRGIRIHFARLVSKLSTHAIDKSQLALGHAYSRSKVKFNVHRVDNMIIQSIALLDQLDKDINTFSMRLREWYSYHFPELYKLVPNQTSYSKAVLIIKDRKNMPEDVSSQLQELLDDSEVVAEVIEAARTSMGMDIAPVDLINVQMFADRVTSLVDYRAELHDYLKERMTDCAPNLAELIGEQVGARLISHAGSLMNLAKYPASTVQILGAEKALFRALKTRSATPKYGLLFHSSFIGRANAKNKGRISRYLANKCSMASRIDCFSETPVSTYGEALRKQVEERLTYFDTGKKPAKNIDVMTETKDVAAEASRKQAKRLRKRAKKEQKEAASQEAAKQEADNEDAIMEDADEGREEPEKKKKKKKKKSIAKNASDEE